MEIDSKTYWRLMMKYTDNNNEYMKNISEQLTRMQALYHLFGEPDIIIGIVPLWNVQMFEVTKSHQKLKYRAIGGQFLAKQRGGRYAIRIDAKLQDIRKQALRMNLGVNITTLNILTALEYMHYRGDVEEKDNVSIIAASNLPQGIKSSQSLSNAIMDGEITLEGGEPKYSYHKTFPIIMRDEILFNMYIESLIYWRSTNDDDPNTINVSILCRKFVPPPVILEIKRKEKWDVQIITKKTSTALPGAAGKPKLAKKFFKQHVKPPVWSIVDEKGNRKVLKTQGYHVHTANFIKGQDPKRLKVTKKKNRIPDKYEILELGANIIHRLALWSDDWIDKKYEKNVTDRISDLVRKNIISNTDDPVSNKSINMLTGKTTIIDFNNKELIEKLILNRGEPQTINDIFWVRAGNSIEDITIIFAYRTGNEKWKNFYMKINQYYHIDISGIRYVFLTIFRKGKLKMEVWRDV